MKRRILSLILASALMFSFVPLVFAATLLTSVSVSVNIMEETGIKRANENLVVWTTRTATAAPRLKLMFMTLIGQNRL